MLRLACQGGGSESQLRATSTWCPWPAWVLPAGDTGPYPPAPEAGAGTELWALKFADGQGDSLGPTCWTVGRWQLHLPLWTLAVAEGASVVSPWL